MKKRIRSAGAVGAVTAMAAGALLVGSTSATAAAPGGTADTVAGATASEVSHAGHHRGPRCMDPWVAGQLAWFDATARHRLAVFDPWVKDQLARYASPSR
ncbi:hypothetical protein AB0L59_10540 [Streptomyces sp. NPDC052109]|uniref:hypothetical protein n=1 Tax=Streptomyces sp. NPDC052109 TaxID=3155527 RepID=UPI00342E623C